MFGIMIIGHQDAPEVLMNGLVIVDDQDSSVFAHEQRVLAIVCVAICPPDFVVGRTCGAEEGSCAGVRIKIREPSSPSENAARQALETEKMDCFVGLICPK